jgi:hypothetical protein
MYTGYLLTEATRNKLLAYFPPKYPDVLCHHITEQFPVPAGAEPPKAPARVEVIGTFEEEGRLDGLLVSIDGTCHRPSGGFYHITMSINKAAGAKAKDSNDALEGKLTHFQPADVTIEVEPKVFA